MRRVLGVVFVVAMAGLVLGSSFFSGGMYFGRNGETGGITTDFVAQVDIEFFTIMGYLKGSEDELHGGDIYVGANLKAPLGSLYGRAEALVSVKGIMNSFDSSKPVLDIPILTKLGVGVRKESFAVEFGAAGLSLANGSNGRQFIPIYKTYTLLGMTF